jgi:hypothetical protein
MYEWIIDLAFVKVKVQQFLYKPGQAPTVPGG